MISDPVLTMKYMYLAIIETGLFTFYLNDSLNSYNSFGEELLVNKLFSEVSFCATRTLAFISLCNVVVNDSLESLYVFFGLKVTLIVIALMEISFPNVQFLFLFYIIPVLAQMAFIIINYDRIIRGALWKYYKVIGTNPSLQSAYNIRTTMRAARFLFYAFLGIRFIVFVLGVGFNPDTYRQITPYFYIVVPLTESLFCFYEVKELVFCKVISLILTLGAIVYMTLIFVSSINRFNRIASVYILSLDILRGIVYFIYSIIDLLYYGTGLKEFYKSRGF